MPGSDSLDAIVIGAGHNGLVTAATLARKGLRVLVLERRHLVGGSCVTEELWPGFRASRAAYVVSLLRPAVIRELELKKHGLDLIPRNPSSFTPLPDRRYLMLGPVGEENRREVSKFSARDAEALPRYEAGLERLARLVESMLDCPPPDPLSFRPRDWARLGSLFLRARAGHDLYRLLEILTAPARAILERWFESEPLRSTLATDSIIGAMVSPSTPGSGYVLLHHVMGETGGARGVWAYARGGMGALSEALASSARAAGARIETGAEVERIIVEGGRAKGVVLSGGVERRARLVASSADPHWTFIRLLAPGTLEEDFRSRVAAIDFTGGSAKINVALDRLPRFLARPEGEPGPQHRGTIHLCPDLEFIERAYLDALAGRPSERPVVECTIPSSLDDSLAPPGKQVMSMFVQYAPYRLSGGRSWDDRELRDSFTGRVFDLVEEYAPGFKSSIIGFDLLSPLDLERTFGLTGGNIFHGAMSLHQLFTSRPVAGWSRYRTPVEGLYLCGAGAHPGGGVMGAAGRNAALEILRDWKRIRRW
jgi:phytoene dehydrogenase-like protein